MIISSLSKPFQAALVRAVNRRAYEVITCTEEMECINTHVRGIMLDFETLSEIDGEATINGRIYIYHEFDPCRSRRYLLIETGAVGENG